MSRLGRPSAFAAVVLGALICAERGGEAQTADNTSSTQPPLQFSQYVPPPTAPLDQAIDTPPVEHLFGDWGGVQPQLLSPGISLRFNALTEFGANVTGGTSRASSFANQIAAQNAINWERLAGIIGLSTHVIMVNCSGSSVSHGFGDNLLPVQEIYGAGANLAVHLVSAYAQETLYDSRLDIELGRMNVENDFASSRSIAAS